MSLTPEELASAQEAATEDLARLADLDDEALDALAHAGDEPELDDLECDHTEPRLTDEEWQFVLDLEAGNG